MSEINTLWKVDNVTHVIEDGGVIEVLYSATTSSGEYIFANSIDLTQPYDVNLRKILKASNFIINSLWD